MYIDYGRNPYFTTASQQLNRTNTCPSDSNLYFQKHYRLMVHSITFKSQLHVNANSEYLSRPQTAQVNHTIYFDDVIDVCLIDVVNDARSLQSIADHSQPQPKSVEVAFYNIEAGKKHQIATCLFDMNLQKIVKEQSKQFMKMPLAKGKQGYLEYKFISLRTRQVTLYDFQKEIDLRNKHMKMQLDAEEDPDTRALRQIIRQKNSIIEILEKKVQQLVGEVTQLKKQSAGYIEKDQSLDRLNKSKVQSGKSLQKRQISLNVKVTPSTQHTEGRIKVFKQMNDHQQKQLKALRQQNIQLQQEVSTLRIKTSELEAENRYLTDKNNLLESIPYENFLNQSETYTVSKDVARNNLPADMKSSVLSVVRNGESSRQLAPIMRSVVSEKQQEAPLRHSSSIKKLPQSSLRSSNAQQTPQEQKATKSSVINKLVTVDEKLGKIKQEDQEESRQIIEEPQSELRATVSPHVRFLTPKEEIIVTIPNTDQAMNQKNQQMMRRSLTFSPITQSQYTYLKNTIQKSPLEQKANMILQRMRQDNKLLAQRLRIRQAEVLRLKADNQHWMNRVKMTERSMEDIRQNSKSLHQKRLEQSRRERQKVLRELQETRMAPLSDFEVYKVRMNELIEKVRLDNTKLSENYAIAEKMRMAQEEKNRAEATRMNREIQGLNSEKELFERKFLETQEKFRRESESMTERYIQIEEELENMKAELAEALLARESVEDNLEEAQKSLSALESQTKTLKQRIKQRQGEWSRLKIIEAEQEPMRKKIDYLQKLGEKYERNLNEVKKYAGSIEGLYYGLRREYGKKDSGQVEVMEKELSEKLVAVNGEIGKIFREISQTHKQALIQYQKAITDQFALKQNLEIKLINERVDSTTQQTKEKLIKEKQSQAILKRDQKLEQLQNQIQKVQKKHQDYQQIINKVSEKAPLNQRIAQLQKIVIQFAEDKKEWQQKNEEERANGIKWEQLALRQQHQLNKMKDSVSGVQSPDQSQSLVQSPQGEPNPQTNNAITNLNRSRIWQEYDTNRRQRLQSDIKKLQQNKIEQFKKNQDLIAELSAAKYNTQMAKLKSDEEIKRMEITFNKERKEKSVEIERVSKELAKMTEENAKMVAQLTQLTTNVTDLAVELESTSDLMLAKDRQVQELSKVAQEKDLLLGEIMQNYNKLIGEVNHMKEEGLKAEIEFKDLLEERNRVFDEINTVKDKEIRCQVEEIARLEYSLQQEFLETLTAQKEKEELSQKVTQLEAYKQQLQQALQITKQTLARTQAYHLSAVNQLSGQNEQVEKHIIELAEQLEARQKGETEMLIRIDSLNKQIEKLMEVEQGCREKEQEWNNEKQSLQEIIADEQHKMKEMTQLFAHFQQQVKASANDHNTLLVQFQTLTQKHDQLEADYKTKDRRVIELEVMLNTIQGRSKEREDELRLKEEDLRQTLNTYKHTLIEKENQVEEFKIRLSQIPPIHQKHDSTPHSHHHKRESRQSCESPHNQSFSTIKSKKSSRGKHQSRKHSSPQSSRNIGVKKQSNIHITDSNNGSSIVDPVEAMFGQVMKVDRVDSEIEFRAGQVKGAKGDDNHEFVQENEFQQRSEEYEGTGDNQLQEQESGEENSRVEIENEERFYQNTFGEEPDGRTWEDLVNKIAELEEKNQSLAQELNKLSHMQQLRGLNSTGQEDSYDQQHLRQSQYSFKNKLQRQGSNHFISTNERLQTKEQLSGQESPQSERRRALSQERGKNGFTSRERKLSEAEMAEGKAGSRQKVGSQGFVERRDVDGEIEALELTVQELQLQLQQVKSALQEQRQANEKIMEELNKQIQSLEEQTSLLLQQKQSELNQIKSEYEHEKQLFEQRVEQMVGEGLQKDRELAEICAQFEEEHEKTVKIEKEMLEIEEILEENNEQMERMRDKLEANRREFRKYEEEAEHEILSLKEKIDSFAEEIKHQHEELQLMAEKYLALEQEKHQAYEELHMQKNLIHSKQAKIESIAHDYEQMLSQLTRTQSARKSLLSQVQQAESQKLQMQSILAEMNKSFSLSVKKHAIESEELTAHIAQLKQKLSQKDQHLVSVKGQIAHYNEECDSLKRVNHTLNLELQKVEKSLKDIMLSYQEEEDDLHKKYLLAVKNFQQLQKLMQEKDDELIKVGKQIRAKDKEIQELKVKLVETTMAYEKYKQSKNSELQGYIQRFSYKQDEYQKLKLVLDKAQEEWFNSECGYLQMKEKHQQQLAAYKDKLTKYETAINDLSTEILKEVEERPTKQAHDEIVFENQMFKNRIKELEEMLDQKNGYVSPKISQQLSHEYRRYKITKESELKDLEDEMQKYCAKVLQLEEGNYELRREIDRLRYELMEKIKGYQDVQEELQAKSEELEEAKGQIDFYQRKRNQELNKLLNETFE